MRATQRNRLARIAIIGGGPAGVGCALTMLREGAARGARPEVLLLEPKHFGRHYNQCAGVVVSEHLRQTLGQCGERFPQELVQRTIQAYVLRTGKHRIVLEAGGAEGGSCAMRRVQFDEHLLRQVTAAGATVVPDRLTDLEFTSRGVVIYTEGPTYRADVVVGAFGLDPGAARVFGRRTGYRPPPCIDTLVTKVHPAGLEPIEGLLEDRIHAILPRLKRVEYGALIPKGNHISVIVAGAGVTLHDMERFLELPEVAEVLPRGVTPGECFRGAFPLGLAHRFCGDRYLIAGDAAGLVRPFKGGGINTALLTGRKAGLCLLEHGVSPRAAAAYLAACDELRRDVWYGRQLRRAVALLSGPLRMEAVLALAHRNPAMRALLYDCVTGRVSYRQAARQHLSLRLLVQATWACLSWPWWGARKVSDGE